MTDPRMLDPEQNFAHYRENMMYEKNDDRYNEPRVKWIKSRLIGAKRVLDAGCNDAFLSLLCPTSAHYSGIELNNVALRNAPSRADILFRANIVDFDYSSLEPVDVVVCSEVLEHLPDPLAFLQRVHKALNNQGRLLTTSPVGTGERFEPGNRDHLREWNGAEYRKLHESAGYRVTYYGMERVYGFRMTHCVEAVPA